jgi:hypothetical protein
MYEDESKTAAARGGNMMGRAEATSVCLINTLREAQKSAEETLCILGGKTTEERPKVGGGGGPVFQQMDTAQALAGEINLMIHEILKHCHAIQARLGE